MCGICASVFYDDNKNGVQKKQIFSEEHTEKLKRRGTNCFNTVSNYVGDIHLQFFSSVLHLRGMSVVAQPFVDQIGNVLLWNGEIFGGLMKLKDCESDTEALAHNLFNCSNVDDVLKTFSSLQGPYAFVFYQDTDVLWFGRDVFGRRSLLWKEDNCNSLSSFHLSSVALDSSSWEEVPTDGIFCLDLHKGRADRITKYHWTTTASGMPFIIQKENTTKLFEAVLSDLQIPCPILKKLNRDLPSATDINIYKLLESDFSENQINIDLFNKMLTHSVISELVERLESVMSDSVKKRVENQPGFCKKCSALSQDHDAGEKCHHASVGVLYSGGLDSIVIACLVDRYVPSYQPIDLINVAFENVKPTSTKKNEENIVLESEKFNTPDRKTGCNGIKELQLMFPYRTWNFVEVNISQNELKFKRKESISELLAPSCTVLDDSIGCALWFAARGEGLINVDGKAHLYSSPCRVLLVGMGADEQLAGYARHRGKFSNCGWAGLLEELSLELDRIGSRNLGRDDRMISDHAVESRYPYLDENVVSFLNETPIWLKANLSYPRGIGEKLLLRLLAYKLGLRAAAALPKRAIQFGSRIAKMENTKEKGSDVCQWIC